MKMYTKSANSMREIEEFVNSSGIARENILTIFQSSYGDYTIVYYSE